MLTPILHGRERDVARYLDELSMPGRTSPLARVSGTHFARWVMVDGFRRGAGQRFDDPLAQTYLLFTSNADGPLDRYLDVLCSELLEEARRTWGCCIGAPSPLTAVALKSYLQHNQLTTGLFFSAYPTMSVPEVRNSLDLRNRLIEFALAAEHLAPAELQRAFDREFRR